jgi:hypothetical protein
MRKLAPAQKLDLVLAHPACKRIGKNSFVHIGESGETHRLHAMYSTLYPRQFLTISATFDWKSYRVSYHMIGQTASFSSARAEVGIACPVQSAEFEWAPEMAKFTAAIVALNTVRLTEISPCVASVVPAYGADQAVFYIPDAWSRVYKETLFEDYAEHNAWLAQLYTAHAAALEATPKCTSLQVQQQLDKAAALGGLRPELAARWQVKTEVLLP